MSEPLTDITPKTMNKVETLAPELNTNEAMIYPKIYDV